MSSTKTTNLDDNDDDDSSILSLSNSLLNDSLLCDDDLGHKLIKRKSATTATVSDRRNPFAKPKGVIKDFQYYLNNHLLDISDDDNHDKASENEKNRAKLPETKPSKSVPKKKGEPINKSVELIEIDDDDDEPQLIKEVCSQSRLSGQSSKSACSPSKTREVAPIKSKSSPSKKSRTSTAEIDLTMNADDEEKEEDAGVLEFLRAHGLSRRKLVDGIYVCTYLPTSEPQGKTTSKKNSKDNSNRHHNNPPPSTSIEAKCQSPKMTFPLDLLSNDVIMESPLKTQDLMMDNVVRETSTLIKTSSKVATKTFDSSSDDDDNQHRARFTQIKERFAALVSSSNSSEKEANTQLSIQEQVIQELQDCSFNDICISDDDNQKPKTKLPQDTKLVDHDDHWMEIDDGADDVELAPTNLRSSTPWWKKPPSASPPALVAQRGRMSAMKKKSPKLKGTTPTKARPKAVQVKKALFQSDDVETSAPPQPIAKQVDAIKHIVARIPSSLLDFITRAELELLKVEKGFNFVIDEADADVVDPIDGAPSPACIRWQAMPSLVQMLQESATTFPDTVRVLRSSSILDHLMIVIEPPLLHECVAHFVRSTMKKWKRRVPEAHQVPDDEQFDLFALLRRCCHKYATYNIVLVVRGLDVYMRQQRTQANRVFRQRMNQFLAEQEARKKHETATLLQKPKKQKEIPPPAGPEIELNLSNIEKCLVEARMRFYYAFHGMPPLFAAPHFSSIYVNSGGELAGHIYRFSRSLSEQVFRLKNNYTGYDFFIQHNYATSIDPTDEANCRDLWRQQLQQFPRISAPIIHLISVCFPTPLAFFKELEEAKEDGEDVVKMLAECSIGHKKVGKAMATKIVLFMLSTEPNEFLRYI